MVCVSSKWARRVPGAGWDSVYASVTGNKGSVTQSQRAEVQVAPWDAGAAVRAHAFPLSLRELG